MTNQVTNHEGFRELIALRLYGETDVAETARLEKHLATCAECGTFASQIESGLGAMAKTPHAAAEMPSDWSARLSAATREPRRPRRISPWWSAVAGFAAGVVAAAMVGRSEPGASPRAPERVESTWERFHRDTPPPVATTQGQLAQFGSYLRR